MGIDIILYFHFTVNYLVDQLDDRLFSLNRHPNDVQYNDKPVTIMEKYLGKYFKVADFENDLERVLNFAGYIKCKTMPNPGLLRVPGELQIIEYIDFCLINSLSKKTNKNELHFTNCTSNHKSNSCSGSAFLPKYKHLPQVIDA